MTFLRRRIGRISLGLLAAGILGEPASGADPRADMPEGACDCHVHIIGPRDRYPMIAERSYTPPEASVEELLALRRRLGIARNVLVQPSFYGTDNRCMLDGLKALGNTARAVAVLPPDATENEMRALDAQGVRGVRVNVESGGSQEAHDIGPSLSALARRLAAVSWHLQIYAALPVIAKHAVQIADLPVPVVIDHFGLAIAERGTEQPGFNVLLDLLRSGRVFVKLSAPYRMSKDAPAYANAGPIARALIEAGPERIVWGTDWPHTDRAPGAKSTDVSPFRRVDDAAVLSQLLVWCPDAAMRRAILVDTPSRLYRFDQP